MSQLRWWMAACLVIAIAVLAMPRVGQADGAWVAPRNLSSSAADTTAASIARDSAGRVHAVWAEGEMIYHGVQTGGVWSAPVALLAGSSPQLAADSAGAVHLAFTRPLADADDVYYAAWRVGEGWGLSDNVSESAADSLSPRIVSSPAGLAIVWCETYSDTNCIYLAESADGDAWTSAPIPNAEGSQPVVAYEPGGALVVVWQDAFDLGFPLDVFASQRAGGAWALPVNVSYSALGEATLLHNSSSPALAAGAAGVALAWGESGEVGSAIWWARLDAEGWGQAEQVTAANAPYGPALAFDAAGLGQFAWGVTGALAYRTWNPSGGVWGGIETVASGHPDVSLAGLVPGDAPHVIWLAQATSGNRDVYHSQRAALTPTVTPTATVTPTRTATPSPTATIKPITPAARVHLPLLRKH